MSEKQMEKRVAQMEKRVENALDFIFCFGGSAGSHHKAWTLDRVARLLCGCEVDIDGDGDFIKNKKYNKLVKSYDDGEDGPNTYEWNAGVAP